MTLRSTTAAALTTMLLMSSAAFAQAGPGQAVEMACRDDVARLCPNVPPGGGKIIECLKAQKAQVSFGCKKALYQAHKAKQAQQGRGGPLLNNVLSA